MAGFAGTAVRTSSVPAEMTTFADAFETVSNTSVPPPVLVSVYAPPESVEYVTVSPPGTSIVVSLSSDSGDEAQRAPAQSATVNPMSCFFIIVFLSFIS